MQTLTDLFGDIVLPFRVLLVAGLGVVFAILLLRTDYEVVAACLGVAVVVAFLADAAGASLLPGRPRAALFLMEFWILAPGMVAAVAAGAAVVVGVKLAPSSGLAAEVSGVMEATAAGLTAFLTGAFVSWVGEKDSSRIADRIRRRFFARYARAETLPLTSDGKKYFTAESRGERAVFSTDIAGVAGWGIDARWKRAKILAVELASGESDPPPPAGEAQAQVTQAEGAKADKQEPAAAPPAPLHAPRAPGR